MTSQATPPWVWDQYWHGDRTTLCFGAGDASYRDDLAEGWRDWYAGFPDGARLLDLCTGNGALPLIALAVADRREASFDLVGVDYAAIDPAQWLQERSQEARRITFQGGVDIADLPFENESFLGISSQYGIEYADRPRALAEAARVLAPQGRGRFVLHAREGSVHGGAVDGVKRIRAFLDTCKLFEAATRAIKAQRALSAKPVLTPKLIARARKTEAAVQEAMRDATAFIGPSPDDFVRHTLTYVQATLRAATARGEGALPATVLDEQLKETEGAVRAHLGRLGALVEAAVDETGALDMVTELKINGLETIPPAPVRAATGNQIGWLLSFEKPA